MTYFSRTFISEDSLWSRTGRPPRRFQRSPGLKNEETILGRKNFGLGRPPRGLGSQTALGNSTNPGSWASTERPYTGCPGPINPGQADICILSTSASSDSGSKPSCPYHGEALNVKI